MNVIDQNFVQGFIRMCSDGYRQGWHERNGGNLSYRIRPEEITDIQDQLNEHGVWFPIGAEVPSLKDEFFLVTGSGKYFRNVELDPENNLAIIKIDETGKNYQIQWGLAGGGKPTSELPSHLMNHAVKKACTKGLYRVVYHAHTSEMLTPLPSACQAPSHWLAAEAAPQKKFSGKLFSFFIGLLLFFDLLN